MSLAGSTTGTGKVNVVVIDERAYRRRVTVVTLLYLCGWLPGVISNWRLRKRLRTEYRTTGVKPPGMGIVAFQFWCFTVFPAAIIILALL
jgi:hypothetical protein